MQIDELDDQRRRHLHRSGAPQREGNSNNRLERRARGPGARLLTASTGRPFRDPAMVRPAVRYAAFSAVPPPLQPEFPNHPRGSLSAIGSVSALYAEGQGFEQLAERYCSDAPATWIWAYDTFNEYNYTIVTTHSSLLLQIKTLTMN
uniref:Uncharacterized protein n=1 Tax=Romanomermis culicivorax TaxID=13658 RepID=A0A915I6E5_ROMCU